MLRVKDQMEGKGFVFLFWRGQDSWGSQDDSQSFGFSFTSCSCVEMWKNVGYSFCFKVKCLRETRLINKRGQRREEMMNQGEEILHSYFPPFILFSHLI